MRIKFRRIKDMAAGPLYSVLSTITPWPAPLRETVFGAMRLAGKSYYYMPASHVRRTLRNFCAVTGRNDARRIYFDTVNNAVRAISLFGRLMREGPDAVAQVVEFEGPLEARLRELQSQGGNGIFVVPHCAGSVLSATGFAKAFPTVVLVRESKSEKRRELGRKYLEKLGAEVIYVRMTEPTTVARAILKALHDKKFIVGTTDLVRPVADTVEARMFGQRVMLPAWPARFSARRKVPILPGYIRMAGDQILIVSGEPYIEQDLATATQRWADYFERKIREYPADWVFMYDKRWSAVLAAAARANG